ncbi:MAG: RNA polymerase sigma factor [Steroidobacteraceae bacterium]
MSTLPAKAELFVGNALAERFSSPLRSYFLRRVHDRDNAEDLTQEVLLRVIRAGETESIQRPESYVFKVAANLLNDLRRSAARRPGLTSLSGEEVEEGTTEGLIDERSPERVILGEADLAQVLSALGELSEMTRNVFILFRLENMKQKDIATLYGIAQSTVEKHVMRAVLHIATRCGGQ